MFDQDSEDETPGTSGSQPASSGGYFDDLELHAPGGGSNPSTSGPSDHGTVVVENRQRNATSSERANGVEDEPGVEYVSIRPGWYRIGRGLIIVGFMVFAAVLAYRQVRTWFEHQLDPEGEPTEQVAVIVPTGATTANIGRLLQDYEIVPNSTFFRYYAEWKDEGNFQAGEYIFYENSSAQETIDILNLGPKPQLFERFTVPEGLWISEMMPVIADQLDGVTVAQLYSVLNSGQVLPRYRPAEQTSWEGLLFSDTYEVSEDADALEVLLKMSDEFSNVTGDLSYGTNNTPLNLSAYEVLIVASLIEAETRVADERPLVASVIYNRLREGIPLGIDAVCIYGTGDRKVELTRSILDDPGDFGCRVNRGLPPHPISSPSRASLEAAISPAESTFIFYVLTDPEGRHSFSSTSEQFAADKQICKDLGLGC